jgi:Delta7-sterol 5-desaturase
MFLTVRMTVQIAISAAPLYAMLPVIVEALVESGVTRAYSRVADVGLWVYVCYFVLYMALVEVGVYCMHRGLHDFKPGYRYPRSMISSVYTACKERWHTDTHTFRHTNP